jgi:16S rRNA (uracil1498-N3)-methyltransferase
MGRVALQRPGFVSTRAFVSPGSACPGELLRLAPEESHYVVRVRRTRAGDPVELLDGAASRFFARVVDADPTSAQVEVGAAIPPPPPGPEIALLVGLCEPRATLQAIAAACAGAATRMVLVRSRQSAQAAPAPSRIERVLRAAMRQCGRPGALAVDSPVALDAALARDPHLAGFLARPGAPRTSWPTLDGLRILIGPPGDFTEHEHRSIADAGFRPVSLGPWTLRSETAVTAALALAHGSRAGW